MRKASVFDTLRMPPFRWLRDLILDYGLVAASAAAVSYSWWFLLPALILIGSRQQAILVLGHDGAHRTITKAKWVNDWLSNVLCYFPFGITLSGFRAFHLSHHKNLGTPEDPERGLLEALSPRYSPPSSYARIMKLALVAGLGDGLKETLNNIKIITRGMTDPDLLKLITFWAALVMLTNYLNAWWVFDLWVLALFTGFPVFFRLRVWIEHINAKGSTHRVDVPLLWKLICFPHNIWIHWEHHKNMAVPYYDLPSYRKRFESPEILPLKQLFDSYSLCDSKKFN